MKNYFLQKAEAKEEKKIQSEKEENTLKIKLKKDREIKLLKDRWKKAGFLEELKDDYHAEQLAIILENQSLWEKLAGESGLGEVGVPLVHEIYKNFLGFEIISVQTMFGPADSYFQNCCTIDETKEVTEDGYMRWTLEHREVVAKTRKLKTYGDLTKENMPILAKSIREEIEREIFTDLRNNAGTVCTIANKDISGEDLFWKIGEVSSVIWRKTLRNLNHWVVTNKEIAERICSGKASFTEKNKPVDDGIYYWGVLNNRWKIIVDSLYPANQMLMGQYEHYNSGYTYCPYVPLTVTPRIVSPDFCPRPGFLVRYGKKLDKDGAKFYAKIKFGAE